MFHAVLVDTGSVVLDHCSPGETGMGSFKPIFSAFHQLMSACPLLLSICVQRHLPHILDLLTANSCPIDGNSGLSPHVPSP